MPAPSLQVNRRAGLEHHRGGRHRCARQFRAQRASARLVAQLGRARSTPEGDAPRGVGRARRPPLTEVETVEQVWAAQTGSSRLSSEVAPEVATELVHQMLDKQYRATLDAPVGMLDGPRS